MKNINTARKYFTRQADRNDCGPACISMILNYTGRYADGEALLSGTTVPLTGFSLLQLRNLAATFGMESTCVRMDIQTLRNSPQPVILHAVNENGDGHFLVCFGAYRSGGVCYYLVADPATQVRAVSEKELEAVWPGRAALYFENIREEPATLKGHPLVSLLKIRSFRKTLLITVPFLNICSTLLGIALSWMLQRGINDSLTDKKTSLVIAVIALLTLITLFKSLLSYIRQHVLIRLNSALNEQLNRDFISAVVSGGRFPNKGGKSIRSSLADIQKIQNAMSAFVAVLFSEGALVTLILAGVWYDIPMAGVCNTVYIVLMAYLTYRSIPAMAYDAAHLNELGGSLENELADEALFKAPEQPGDARLQKHFSNHHKYLTLARSVAVKISRQNLIFEWIGTVNVILILVICLREILYQRLSYDELIAVVILSYFMTALVPKVCNAYSVIHEGAGLIRRYQFTEPNP